MSVQSTLQIWCIANIGRPNHQRWYTNLVFVDVWARWRKSFSYERPRRLLHWQEHELHIKMFIKKNLNGGCTHGGWRRWKHLWCIVIAWHRTKPERYPISTKMMVNGGRLKKKYFHQKPGLLLPWFCELN